MNLRTLILLCLVLLNLTGFSQTREVYLIGNLKGPKLKKRLKHFSQSIDKESKGSAFTLLLLGDLRQKNQENENTLVSFLKEIELKNGKVIAVTGDRDWDKASIHGLDTVAALEHRFKDKLGHNIFIPKRDCPGPHIKDIDSTIRIIGINSQWWLHPYRKVLPVDSECKRITKVQILDELNEAIASAGKRTVILMTHHPIISGGVYGGNPNLIGHIFPYKHDKPNNKTFLPLYGTFYHNYRRNIGTEQDFSSHAYQTFINDIEGVLLNHSNVIICSSHEYDSQLLKLNNNYQLISGGLLKTSQVSKINNSIYYSKELAYNKLEISDKKVISKLLLYDKKENTYNENESHIIVDRTLDEKEKIDITRLDVEKYKIDGKYFGGEYKAGFFKRIFFGSLYRDAWTEPIEVPMLDLDTTFGGLTPLKEGGGLQTVSLKFKDKYGKKYAFRSIDKTPVKSIPIEFRLDLVKDITQDMTATQHPYGGLFVAELLDATELYHEKAKLYIMPDSPKLGKHRDKFRGMFGTLEPKPTQLKDLNYSYQNANYVKSTLSVFKKLYHSPKNTIDTLLLAKARVFDIFIGDWDRHEDNWKWIGFKSDSGGTVYKPYPKDRDHAFSKMDGLFYFLADREWGVAFRENFDYKFSGIQSLTVKGSHLDRMLLNGLEKSDWLHVTNDLMGQITDSVIDNSRKGFPKEIQEKSGKIIANKLKSRKKHLSNAIEKYYRLLSKEVDIIGTNKKEHFDIHRLTDGKVRVQMYSTKLKDKLLLDRTFLPSETHEIRIYGLGEIDSFYVHGESYRSILVRIVGGDDKDIILDESFSRVGGKKTLIYDYPDGASVEGGKEFRKIYTNNTAVNEYDQTAHKNNTYLPVPLFLSNPDDGLGGGFVLNQFSYGFGHSKYKNANTIRAFVTSNGAALLSIKNKRNIARTNLFVVNKLNLGYAFPFYSFYGVGNNSVINDSIFDQGLYRTRYRGTSIYGGLTYEFFDRSSISFNVLGEFLSQDQSDQSYFDLFPNPNLSPTNASGGEVELEVDFRDSPTFTTRGIRLRLANKTLAGGGNVFGNYQFELSYYGTSKLLIPVTLGLKLGSTRTFGETIPFYHLANMGQSNHLRGYLQNRFAGEAANYLNTDLRFHIGKTKSDFLPLYYGLTLFTDFGQIVDRDDFTGKDWHQGFGGGLYITPINKEFITLQINVERSDEQDALIKFNFGVLL